MRCENKTFLQNDPGFLQEISSTAVEVGLGRTHSLVNVSRNLPGVSERTRRRIPWRGSLPGGFIGWDDLKKGSYFREERAVASAELAGGSELSEG